MSRGSRPLLAAQRMHEHGQGSTGTVRYPDQCSMTLNLLPNVVHMLLAPLQECFTQLPSQPGRSVLGGEQHKSVLPAGVQGTWQDRPQGRCTHLTRWQVAGPSCGVKSAVSDLLRAVVVARKLCVHEVRVRVLRRTLSLCIRQIKRSIQPMQ